MQTLDTILVLTGPLRYRDREARAADLWKGQDPQYRVPRNTPIIITGNYTGFADYMGEAPPAVPDAAVMRDRMIEMDIPEGPIIIESKAKDTVANFVYAEQILHGVGAKEVGLVTSKYHMQRSLRIGDHIYGGKYTLHPCPSENGGSAYSRIFEPVITEIIMHDLGSIRRGDQAAFEEYLATKHPFHGATPGGLYTRFVLLQKNVARVAKYALPTKNMDKSAGSGSSASA